MSSNPFPNEAVISVENVSKAYAIYEKPADRLKQMLSFGRKKYYREFPAVTNVSFSLKPGESLGIVGRNGSGKSTLLQMISGTLQPTSGSIAINGRIAALLELGAGFNPEFTGHENIFLNASVLGLTDQEIRERYDDILGFADIGDFIQQPVKTYSSGMYARLAFAVASSVSPDILIVDEILAVGDAKFQSKCFYRIAALRDNGTSILFVSHASEQVIKHCSRAILLEKGRLISIGEPKKIINDYMSLLFGKEKSESPPATAVVGKVLKNEIAHHETELAESGELPSFFDASIEDQFQNHNSYNKHEHRWGDCQATILDYYLEVDGESFPLHIRSKSELTLSIKVLFNENILRPIFGFTIKTKDGVTLGGSNSEMCQTTTPLDVGIAGQIAIVTLRCNPNIAPGDYFISVGVASMVQGEVVPHDRRYDSIHLLVSDTVDYLGITDFGMSIASHIVPLPNIRCGNE